MHVVHRISIFPFGMCGIYGVLVSLAGFANAYFNYFVIVKHPSFTRGVPDYTPPMHTPPANSATIKEEDTTVWAEVVASRHASSVFSQSPIAVVLTHINDFS